jgi:ribosomal protein L16
MIKKKVNRKNDLKKSFINNKITIRNNPLIKSDSYYILSTSTSFITKKQFESCLRIISFYIRKARKYFFSCLQFNQPITKKPRFCRMGSGKGRIRKFVAKVHMNSILFIFKKIDYNKMLKVFTSIQHRLPIKITLKSKTK